MKNFKINRNVTKRIVSFALVTSMMTTLSGCNSSSKSSMLKGTILENSRVITFEDGHIDIAVENDGEYTEGFLHPHNHYRSIITNEKFTVLDCDFYINYKYNIVKDESILIYLTSEELAKVTSQELTDEDIKNVILRIFDGQQSMKKTLTK